jgi:hypothetical protein
LCIIKLRKMMRERPSSPLSVCPLSEPWCAEEVDDENAEAAPNEMPSARAWKSSPMKVEKAGEAEFKGSTTTPSSDRLSLIVIVLLEVLEATEK